MNYEFPPQYFDKKLSVNELTNIHHSSLLVFKGFW